jgi:hypothetical protein
MRSGVLKLAWLAVVAAAAALLLGAATARSALDGESFFVGVQRGSAAGDR